jgi:hypothetical protein
MLEDSYLCEANIEAARIMIDKEWEKSKHIQDKGSRALYLGFACMYPAKIINYYSILFYTHGGC